MGRVLKVFYQIRRVIWFFKKPITKGVRVMLVADNEILLVKHTYQPQWYLPGGQVAKFETYAQAAHRELKEELGATLYGLELFGVYNNFYESKDDTVVVFLCRDFKIQGQKNLEIKAYKMFNLDQLPNETSKGTRKRIQNLMDQQRESFGLW